MGTKLRIKRASGSVEVRWDSFSGYEYYLQATTNFTSWVSYGPYQGNTGTELVVTITTNQPHQFFRLLVGIPHGSEIKATTITAFSGAYVVITWESIGPVASGTYSYDVFRDGVKISTQPKAATQFKDTTVQSGRTYLYSVKVGA